MNILVINYEYPPIGGGGGFVTRDILEHIAALGHRITVVTSYKSGLKKDEYVNLVRVIRVPVFFRKDSEVANIPSMLCYFPSSILSALKRFSRGSLICSTPILPYHRGRRVTFFQNDSAYPMSFRFTAETFMTRVNLIHRIGHRFSHTPSVPCSMRRTECCPVKQHTG